MKKILTIIALLIGLSSAQSQDLPLEDDKVVYEKIISAEGVSKNQVYANAKMFLANNIKSGLATNLTEDHNSGIIILNTTADFYNFKKKNLLDRVSIYEAGYKFMIRIDNKDDKSRIRIYNIYKFLNIGGMTVTQPLEAFIRDNINKAAKQKKEIKRREESQKVLDGIDFINHNFNNIINIYEKSIQDLKKDTW